MASPYSLLPAQVHLCNRDTRAVTVANSSSLTRSAHSLASSEVRTTARPVRVRAMTGD